MKTLLIAAALLFLVSFANVPVSAQNPKGLNVTGKLGKISVRYASTAAFSDGRGVWLEWKTEIESKNLGFYVYRMVGGERELVSRSLIPGAYLQAREEKISSGSYSFFDRFGEVDSTYVIESYHANGRRYFTNLIQTQFVEDLTTVTGISSEQLIKQSESAKTEIQQNDSVLPQDLALEVEQLSSPADAVTQRWVAAQPGAKIGVRNEGVYRVTRAELEANGFNVNAPTALWQLYVNGVQQAINVGDNGDYIEFYGRGINTLYADTQIYFLVVGTENGKRIGTNFRRRLNGSVLSDSYAQSFFRKENTIYTSTLLNGDVENFYGTVVNVTGEPINFNLSGVDFGSVNSSIDLSIQGITFVNHQIKVVINNVEIGTITGSNFNLMSKHLEFPTSALREGANTLRMFSLNNVPGANDVSLFSTMKVNFERLYRANQNRLSFHVPNYKASYVEGFTSPNIRVFDTTNPDTPILITNLSVEPNGVTFRVYLPSNRGRVMFAVEDSGILPPSSITRNDPSILSTTANHAELLIISHRDLMTQAENWAAYRRAQGLTVKVVGIEDVYDEFNFGVVSADCIRNFLDYAKSNWETKPNYVLLIGDATFDPKNHLGNGGDLVPTRLVDTIYSETGSDDTLADFNNDGLAEIAIGRIPARDASTVTVALNKVIAFEQTVAQAYTRGAIFASDLPDGYDFAGLSDRLCSQLPSSIPCIKINRAQPNANALLVNEINNGRFLVNYSGHGSVGVWAANAFFGNTHANQLTNNNNLSIFTMLTCLNGYFINPTDSLSENLLKNPNGGAVATWASSGLTTPDIQEIMATRFYNQIGAGNITRIGDLIKDAKTTINFGRDVRLSWVLLGDPSMKVR